MAQQTGDEGQALVETAVVVPLFLFMFLVMLQLLLLAHGRVMLEYAAFNAARAGVVHNGNNQVMRSAAIASVVPIFGDTSSLPHYLETWGKLVALEVVGTTIDQVVGNNLEAALGMFGINAQGRFPNLEIVRVDVLNPGPSDFSDDNGNPDEIDLDLAQQTTAPVDAMTRTRLSIRVRILYPLRIPVANRLLFYAFMLSHYFDRAQANEVATTDWLRPRIRHQYGGAGSSPEQFLRTNEIPTAQPDRPLEVLNDIAMYQFLKRIPDLDPEHPMFFIPMYAFHSMPMESNFFKRNLQ